MDQQPPVGRDSMDFRKEQKVEIANLEHKENDASSKEVALSIKTSLPETGEKANLWSVYGMLSLLLAGLWKVISGRKEEK